jgi:hypothetical protein
MLSAPFNKNLLIITAMFIAATCLTSCQKEISSTGIRIETEPTDLSTKITSSVSGFVTDENEVAVQGASVVFGNASASTDKFGYFEIRNQQVVQQAAVVSIIKPGYFKAVKTYIATANKSAFFRVKMLPKKIAGTVDAAAGGKVSLFNGLSVTLPAGAVVNAATGNAYTGTVSVAAQWLDPTATDLDRIMPGDLRGLNTDGALKLLQTFGMSAVELTGSAGELLQVATGKKATVSFPLPSSVAGTAPNSIPLWYFDEAKGLWKEEGSAVRSGNNYVGEVSHFSYWNCDSPIDQSVQFTCTIVDAAGRPLPYVSVWIEYANGGWVGAHGGTDSSGYVAGVMPANAQVVIKIFTDYACIGNAYIQTITTTNVNLSLGEITVGATNTATLTGNVVDCNNVPVTNGNVIMQYNNYGYITIIKPDGTFSLSTLICSNSSDVSLIAIDNSAKQQSSVLLHTIVPGLNALASLNACGTSLDAYINYSINNTNYSIIPPVGAIYAGVSSSGVYIQGNVESNGQNGKSISMNLEQSGIAVNSTQKLLSFNTLQVNDSINVITPVLVNISEYGAIGEYIAGEFTGTFTGAPPANRAYNITCNFRVRRSQ